MKKLLLAFGVLAGCSHHAATPPAPTDMAQPYARTLVTQPLNPTAPTNLIVDPFIGGENGDYGKFYAFTSTIEVGLTRTFQSVSPVGGAVSIGELRAFDTAPVDAVVAVLGGSGQFSASIWLSAGDASGQPVPWATALSHVKVSLLDASAATKTMLVGDPTAVVTFGTREWLKWETQGGIELPTGGYLDIDVDDTSYSLQMAAPEVLSSTLTGTTMSRRALPVPMTDHDREVTAHPRPHAQRPRRRR